MQSLRRRLNSAPSRAWPDHPVPIALVITDLDVGGAEKALVALATRLDRSRWQPHVICLDDEGALAATLREADIAVTCLGVDRRSPSQAVIRLGKALRRCRPALIQSFLFHANIASKLAAPMAGRPWVLGGFRVAEREKHWHLALERATQGLSLGWVCVSEGVRRHAVQSGRLDPARMIVIPNGIDVEVMDCAPVIDRMALRKWIHTDRGQPRPEGPHLAYPTHRVALFVGRIERQKGLPILLEAFGKTHADHPGWALWVVGDGPDLPRIKEQADAFESLGNNVVWFGRREDVPSLMKAVDLVVLPSLWEGMPNVVLEAMAAGKPVIATKVEGSEDLVVDRGPGRTGWLVEPGDVASLRGALREAMSRSDLLSFFGRRGRNRADAWFSMRCVVTSYEAVWSDVLGLRQHGTSTTWSTLRGLEQHRTSTTSPEFGVKPDADSADPDEWQASPDDTRP